MINSSSREVRCEMNGTVYMQCSIYPLNNNEIEIENEKYRMCAQQWGQDIKRKRNERAENANSWWRRRRKTNQNEQKNARSCYTKAKRKKEEIKSNDTLHSLAKHDSRREREWEKFDVNTFATSRRHQTHHVHLALGFPFRSRTDSDTARPTLCSFYTF